MVASKATILGYGLQRFLRDHGVPVIEGSVLLDGHPTKDLVINPSDAHPSEHRLVADALYHFVAKAGLCRNTPSPR